MAIEESVRAEVSMLTRSRAGSPHALTPSRRAPRRAVRRGLAGVPAGHPVREDVVDRRRLDEALAAAIGLERTPLPEEVGVDALVNAHRGAGAIVFAFRILAPHVDKVVSPWPLEPEVEEHIRLGVPSGIGAAYAAVDHVEVGVLMAPGAAAQRGERLHVERQCGGQRLLEANEVVEVDVVEVELEVAGVRVEAFTHDRQRHLGGEWGARREIDGREALGVYGATDLEEGERLAGRGVGGRGDRALGDDDGRAGPREEVQRATG